MSSWKDTPNSFSKYEVGDKITSLPETDEEIYAKVNKQPYHYHSASSSSSDDSSDSNHGSIQELNHEERVLIANGSDPHGPVELNTNTFVLFIFIIIIFFIIIFFLLYLLFFFRFFFLLSFSFDI